MKGHDVLLSSKSDEWATPDNIFKLLDAEFNFELDPCAKKNNAKCSTYFDKRHNGLKKSWKKFKSVFVNPPYSNVAKWVEKCYLESLGGGKLSC